MRIGSHSRRLPKELLYCVIRKQFLHECKTNSKGKSHYRSCTFGIFFLRSSWHCGSPLFVFLVLPLHNRLLTAQSNVSPHCGISSSGRGNAATCRGSLVAGGLLRGKGTFAQASEGKGQVKTLEVRNLRVSTSCQQGCITTNGGRKNQTVRGESFIILSNSVVNVGLLLYLVYPSFQHLRQHA